MKRLFKKWLKRKVINITTENSQEIFEWIYESPLSTWKDRLFCIKKSHDLFVAKILYEWISSDAKLVDAREQPLESDCLLSLDKQGDGDKHIAVETERSTGHMVDDPPIFV